LRKEPGREGRLRLIDVEGFDLSACGGTHVARTGAIGIITVPGWERYKAGTRVSFAAGVRALREFDRLRDAMTSVARTLATSVDEAAASLERVQSELKEGRRTLKAMQRKLAARESSALAALAVDRGGRHVVIESLEGWDAGGLKELASSIVSRSGHVAILFSAPPPLNVVVARAADVQIDAAAVLASLVGRFGGKGGGRSELAQGGGLAGAAATAVEYAHTLV
jgi:alanyl-tRNA synthetase